MFDPLLLAASLVTSVYGFFYVWRLRGSGHLVSPASLYAALVLVHIAVPGMLMALDIGPGFVSASNQAYATAAALFSTVSLLALQIGSALGSEGSRVVFRRHYALQPAAQWGGKRIVLVVLLLSALGWAIRWHVIQSDLYLQYQRAAADNQANPFHAAIWMVELFPLYVICILAIRNWRLPAVTPKTVRIALFSGVVAEVMYWLPSGRKEPIILAVILPLIIRFVLIGKLPSRRAVLALAACLVVFIPLSYGYRIAVERIVRPGDLRGTVLAAAETIGVTASDNLSSGVDILLNRLSLLEPVSAAVRLVQGGEWELRLGESYLQGALSVVPRLIWPDKPSFHYGTDFGYAGGFLSVGDWVTSISVTFIGEGFLNFGWLGFLPLMLIGVCFGAIYGKARNLHHQETWLLLYAIVLPTILYIGGTFATYFGGLLKLCPFFYLVGRLMETGSSKAIWVRPSGHARSYQ